MLEGNISSGTLAFDGQVIISNLQVKHNSVEGLAPEAGIDPVASDPRYLRKWQVCEPIAGRHSQFFLWLGYCSPLR
jgi:hypothetical protein